MRKLSEYQGEEAIELLGDILEPTMLILADKEVSDGAGKVTVLKLASLILKKHPKEIIEILARLDGEEPSTYKVNVLTLPTKIIQILNDKDLMDFFASQTAEMLKSASGAVMANTEENEKSETSSDTGEHE